MGLADLLPPHIRMYWGVIKIALFTAFLAAVLAAGFWSGYNYRDGEAAEDERDALKQSLDVISLQIQQNNILQTDFTQVSKEYQELLNKRLEPEVRYVTNTVVREIEKPVYSECVVPDSGVRIFNETVERYNQARDSDSR